MQTMTEATQAAIPSIRHDCSVCLYFLTKESDYILSEFRWRVAGGMVCPKWGFWDEG